MHSEYVKKHGKLDFQFIYEISFKRVLDGSCRHARLPHEKVAVEHSSKSTKYELEGPYNNPVHEPFSSAENEDGHEKAFFKSK